jgi:hypothetical protein
LTVPFELTPAWYAAYLSSKDPLAEFGIPVITLDSDSQPRSMSNPQVRGATRADRRSAPERLARVATLTRAFLRDVPPPLRSPASL